VPEQPNEIESVWSVANGWRVHARAALNSAPDNAPIAVLVHGLVVSSDYMEPLVEKLAPHYRVYAPDLPGFGKSEKPGWVLSIPELADALLAWMDSVSIDRPMLVGNSFGCQIAAEFAMRYPVRARSLVLIGPTVDPRARNIVWQAGRWLANSINEPPSLGPTLVLDYLRAGLVRTLGTINEFISDEIEAKLPRIPVPALVVRGALDPIVPERWAREAKALLPYGELVTIPGTGHTSNYSAPLEVSRVARLFDQKVAEATPVHGRS
jgi:2-hydroxy-6-oxonona-2,4-dienedioate hydrolase